MSKFPSFKPKEVIKKFKKLGYIIDRQSGSHVILYHPTLKKRSTIPLHVKDLPKGTLFSILKEAGISKEEFLKIK